MRRRDFITRTARAVAGVACGGAVAGLGGSGCLTSVTTPPGAAASSGRPPMPGDRIVLPVAPGDTGYEFRRDPDAMSTAFEPTSESESIAEASRFLAQNLPVDGAYFIQLSDAHIGGGLESRYPPFGDSGMEFLLDGVAPTPRVERALREVSAFRPPPEFVVITGDMTDHGQPDELESFLKLLPRGVPPIYLVRGNHEWSLAPLLRATESLPYVDATRMAETGFCYSFDVAGVHHVVLDSEYIAESDAELAWFGGDLAAHGDMPVVVFNHRNLAPVGYPPADWTEGFMQPRAGELLAAMRRHGAATWCMGGHVHANTWQALGDTNLVTLSSLFYDVTEAQTTVQGFAALYAHLVCIDTDGVAWLARKQFAGRTIWPTMGESPWVHASGGPEHAMGAADGYS